MPEEDDERRQMLIESDRENSLSPRLLGQEKRKKKAKSKERTNEQQSSEISNGEVNQGYERDLPPQQEIVSYPESWNIQKHEPNDARSRVDKNDAPLPAENETDQPTKDIKAKKRKKKKKEFIILFVILLIFVKMIRMKIQTFLHHAEQVLT